MIQQKFKQLMFCVLATSALLSCRNEIDVKTAPVGDVKLLSALQTLGYEVRDNQLVVNQKVTAAKTLDLSGKQLDGIKGLEVFTNLETLNLENNNLSAINVGAFTKLRELKLQKNPTFTKIEGLGKGTHNDLKTIVLPASANAITGELPAFVKAANESKKEGFSAKIEQTPGSETLEEYTYYYLFKSEEISNGLFNALSHDAFEVIDIKGKQTTVFNKAEKSKDVDFSKPITLFVRVHLTKDMEEFLLFVNHYFRFLDANLVRLEATVATGTILGKVKLTPLSETLNLSGFRNLRRVNIVNAPLRGISFDQCASLDTLEIRRDDLNLNHIEAKTLSLKDSPKLSRLQLKNVNVEKLEFSAQASPKYVDLDSLTLRQAPDMSKWSQLAYLRINNVAVENLKLRSNDLKTIWIDKTKLKSLDLSECKKMTEGEITVKNNADLTELKFPAEKGSQCNLVEIYKNNLSGTLDLSSFARIRHLRLARDRKEDSKYYIAPEKGSEEKVTSVTVDADALVANALPWKGMKKWDNLMQVDINLEILRNSPTLKNVFLKKGDKNIVFYKFNYLNNKWWQRDRVAVSAADLK